MSTRTQPLAGASASRRERGAWLVLAVLLLFSIAAPLNQFKVPPIMPLLMDALQLSAGRAGMLMSVFAITGLILALPSGLIYQKAGYRITGLIAGGSIVFGAVLGAVSTDLGGLLASRVIEGIGTSLMAVLAPAIIAQWFVARKRGTAMGIWSAWVPVGSSLMLFLAPTLAQAAGWRGVWWFAAVYALLVTILYLVFVRPAPPQISAADGLDLVQPPGPDGSEAVTTGDVLRNRNIWLLGAAFACMNMTVLAFSTFMPTFLSTVRGLPLAQASLLTSITMAVTIFSAPAGGVVSDRLGSRKRPYLVGFLLSAALLPLTGTAGGGSLIVVVVLLGIFTGLIPTNIFSSAVESVGDERQGGLAMAIIMVGQNAGALLGPAIFGALIESAGGWPLAFASLAGMSLLGFLAGWLARVR